MDDLEFRHPWTSAEGSTGTGGGGVHVDEWEEYENMSDYVIFAYVVQNTRGGLNQNQPLTLRARGYTNLEYKTNNMWVDKEVSQTTPQQLDHALEKLRLMPQFYPNAIHLASIGSILKKIGAIGTALGGIIAPFQPEIGIPLAAGSGAVAGGGLLLETLGE
jgi:hypothetical protein